MILGLVININYLIQKEIKMEMIEHVEISPEGLFKYKFINKKFVSKRVKKSSVLAELRNTCKITTGTTLGQIFNVVDQYKMLKIFISQYSWCRAIDEFHAQAKEPINNENDELEQLTHLEINWHVETNSVSKKIKHPGGLRETTKCIDFELSENFIGIGPIQDGVQTYSISYSPMYELIDLPVIINEKFEVYEPWQSGKPAEKVLDSEKPFTLLSVLDAIYWDISFMGGPAENKDFMEEIKRRVDEIQDLS